VSDVININTAPHYTWGGNCDGWHLVRTPDLSVIQERVPPGGQETRHAHSRARQFFFVLSGEAVLELDGERHIVAAQSGLEVPPGAPHQLRNETASDLWFVVISQPMAQGDRIGVEPPAGLV
jgi:mannose-6-phosphate isomerase-like protein (cupin superfamily)